MDQQAHEKMHNIVIIREMQINELSPHTCQNGYLQKEHK